jgi:hypothetical protein
VGARSADQLRQSLSSLDFALAPDQRERLDRSGRIELGFPHDFLASDAVRHLVYSGVRDAIDG